MQFSTAKKTLIKTTTAIGEHTIIKMKLRQILILVLITISPIISFAQKAYETVEYNGNLNGMLIKFSLADGYLPASKITLTSKKSIIFYPENGFNNDEKQIKFTPKTNLKEIEKVYFILLNPKNELDQIPPQLSCRYRDGKKSYNFILKKSN